MHQVVCHPIAMTQFHVHINLQVQISEATKPWLVWDQMLAIKAKTERKIFCYLCSSKIIVKGEVVGM